MWKNIAQPDRPQTTIWRTRIECWIPKATNAPSEYVIIIAFPLQQWLHERASLLRNTYIFCLVYISCTLKKGSCTHPSAAGAIFRCLVGSNCTEDCRLQTKEKKRLLSSNYNMNVTKLNTNSQVTCITVEEFQSAS